MSVYDGIFFVILVGFMILGFVRGLLKEIAAILLMVIPMLAAVLFSPFLSVFFAILRYFTNCQKRKISQFVAFAKIPLWRKQT